MIMTVTGVSPMTTKRGSRAVDCTQLKITNNLKPGESVQIDPQYFVAIYGEKIIKKLEQKQRKGQGKAQRILLPPLTDIPVGKS